jgi:hypothetical protein
VHRTGDGCEILLAEGTDPGAAMRDIAARVAPARMELARVRLEDVFVRVVSEGSHQPESMQALRTHLQGLAVKGWRRDLANQADHEVGVLGNR